MKLIFDKYEDQFQIGIAVTWHNHYGIDPESTWHFHIVVDLGFWYIEFTARDIDGCHAID